LFGKKMKPQVSKKKRKRIFVIKREISSSHLIINKKSPAVDGQGDMLN